VRQTERHIATDPPTPAELEALAADARSQIEAALDHRPRVGASAEAGIAVAGTPTSLAAVELGLDPYDPKRVHGHVLSLGAVQRQLSHLASASLEQRSQIIGLHPDRAPTIVAGIVILIETMRAFGLGEIEVSEHDILYGTAIAAVSGPS
jgi:exopolyphosphatase/guanosine-5'-triphosphate,3'-diphosphate pyrophosphatase